MLSLCPLPHCTIRKPRLRGLSVLPRSCPNQSSEQNPDSRWTAACEPRAVLSLLHFFTDIHCTAACRLLSSKTGRAPCSARSRKPCKAAVNLNSMPPLPQGMQITVTSISWFATLLTHPRRRQRWGAHATCPQGDHFLVGKQTLRCFVPQHVSALTKADPEWILTAQKPEQTAVAIKFTNESSTKGPWNSWLSCTPLRNVNV